MQVDVQPDATQFIFGDHLWVILTDRPDPDVQYILVFRRGQECNALAIWRHLYDGHRLVTLRAVYVHLSHAIRGHAAMQKHTSAALFALQQDQLRGTACCMLASLQKCNIQTHAVNRCMRQAVALDAVCLQVRRNIRCKQTQ